MWGLNPDAIAAALCEAFGASMDPVEQPRFERQANELKDRLSENQTNSLWQEGLNTAPADLLSVN